MPRQKNLAPNQKTQQFDFVNFNIFVSQMVLMVLNLKAISSLKPIYINLRDKRMHPINPLSNYQTFCPATADPYVTIPLRSQ